MRLAFYDRGSLQVCATITIPDHRMPRPVARIETLAFEVKVNEHIILEPKLDVVRVTIAMDGLSQQNVWVAVATSEKSAAMMRLAFRDEVDGIDEVPPQHRPAVREALRAVFQLKEAS